MPKYEIYQKGKLPPLTVIEADGFHLGSILTFYNNVPFFNDTKEETVAQFNWNNIAGFMEV